MTIKHARDVLLICALLIAGLAGAKQVFAIDIDPDITPSKTLVCQYPVTREDGSPLALDEIAKVKAYGGTEPGTYNIVVGENTSACSVVIDFSTATDGTYYYTMTAVDTAGRESAFGEAREVVVKRIKPPTAPTNLQWVD